MSTAFHHKSQVMFTCKIYRRCDIRRITRNNRVNAWRWCPRIQPSGCFCSGWLIGDPEWVAHVLQSLEAGGTFRIGLATGEERWHFNQVPTHRLFELLPDLRFRPAGSRRSHAANQRLRRRGRAPRPVSQEN